MSLYKINADKVFGPSLATVKDNKGRFFLYFIYDEGKSNIFEKFPTEVDFSSFSLNDLNKSDYLPATIGVPFFSKFAAQKISTKCSNIDFHKCQIKCQDGTDFFYAAKINKFLELVDQEESEFRLLTNGDRILSKPIYNKRIETSFYLARDIKNKEIWCAGENFLEIANDLNIGMSEVKI